LLTTLRVKFYSRAEKAWGEGLKGLSLSAAQYALLQLEDKPTHTKHWRPQLLLCTRLENYEPTKPELFDFAKQLKAGKGLTIVTNVILKDFLSNIDEYKETKMVTTIYSIL
jgi:solute carrier family 12 (potassium/chloride transporter), member 4/6